MENEQEVVRRPQFIGERGSETDVLKMLDKLEELLEGSMHLFNRAWFVDLEEFFVLTNKIRASLPDEVKRASRVATDTDRIVGGAREEATRVVEQAREEAVKIVENAKTEVARLVDTSEINKLATVQAKDIVAASEETAREIRSGADQYAREVLTNLENFAAKIIGTIQRGREKLEQRDTVPSTEDFVGPEMSRRERGVRR
jgi:cell division septum initiation protein DivIVA